MWQALSYFHQKEADKAPSLFDPVKTPVPIQDPPSVKEPYSEALMRRHEIETLGFYLSVHPLDLYQNKLSGMAYVRAKDLDSHVGQTVTTIGWRVTGKTIRTKTGKTMKFVSFEDTTGLYETVFFPKVYNRYCHMLNAERPYVLKGKVEEDFGAVNMTVRWVGFLNP
jgi:error-prone DNA polymerase